MSSDNDRFDGSPSADDAALSRLYQDSATETVPPRLDERVLKEARSAARPRFALPIDWMRPLAWTATVGICLAFALNPSVEHEGAVEWNGDVAEPAASLPEQEAASVAIEESAPVAPPRIADVTAVERRASREEALASTAVDDSADEAYARQEPKRQAPAESGGRAARMASDAPVPQAAERKAIALMDQAAVLSEQIGASCEGDDIATPEAWLACIDALDDEGRTEDADAERRRFTSVYPNHVVE